MNEYILQFLITLFAVVVSFLINNMLSSYFNEKSKNIATKEDIGDITKIVENIKTDLQKETITFQSKLDLLYNIELNLINDEKKALVEFHKSFSRWIHFLTNTSTINDENNEKLEKVSNEYRMLYNQVSENYNLLEIYSDNTTFLQKIDTLKLRILELELPLNLELTIIELKSINCKLKTIENDEKKDYLKLMEEKKDIKINSMNNRIEILKQFITEYKDYIKELKKVLKNTD